MARNEMYADRNMRLHLRDDGALGRADIGDDGARLERRRDHRRHLPRGPDPAVVGRALHRSRSIARIADVRIRGLAPLLLRRSPSEDGPKRL